ncbi:MAG: serine/threonine protein kinase [Pleurocapsa sp. MO_226.B13]|nr:serine/threonine protein kinase [Pleurocapsa sp. MO_226.B13]
MSIRFTKLTKLSNILLIASVFSLFSLSAKAEMQPLDEKFEAAYFANGKNAFAQSNIFGQINTIFGFTGFPEQHISGDGKKVDNLYEETMNNQASMGMPIVTRDLTNPYDTSLRENPSYSAIE